MVLTAATLDAEQMQVIAKAGGMHWHISRGNSIWWKITFEYIYIKFKSKPSKKLNNF